MCTHTRVRPVAPCFRGDRVVEVARAAGSIVNVARRRRSRRSPGVCATRSPPRAPRARRPASKRRARPRSSISPSITSRATSGRPSTRRIARRRSPACAPARARGRRCGASRCRAARRLQHEPRGAAPARGRCLRCVGWEQRRGRQEAAAALDHRDDRTRRRGASRRLAAARRGARPGAHRAFAASVLSATARPCSASTPLRHEHFGCDAGALFDAASAEVAPVGGEVLADRDVERAAV